jgi:hypothetical protein
MTNLTEGTKPMRTKKVKFLTAVLACSFCFGLSSTAFAASNEDTFTENEPGAVETYLGNYSTRDVVTSEQDQAIANEFSEDNISAKATYSISNVSKPMKSSFFNPLTIYQTYPSTISLSRGVTTTINASVTGGGGVDIKFLKANVSATIGGSISFTSTQTITYPTVKDTKGRIILRYSQDYYTYTITKAGIKYPGSGYTQAYDEYYALQSLPL